MTKLEKTWEFIKSHKKVIIAGCVTLVCGGVVFAITKQGSGIKPILEAADPHKWDLPIPETKVGNFEHLWLDGGERLTAIICDLKPSDLGALGEELLNIEGVDPETVLGMVLEKT
jgi:hypothetical protein